MEPWDIRLSTYREVPLSRKLCDRLAGRGTPYVDDDDSIEDESLKLSKAQMDTLGDALSTLDVEDLDILDLRFVQGVSQAGVGMIFGVSQAAISQRERSLLKRLRLLVKMVNIPEESLRERLQTLSLLTPDYERMIELFVEYWRTGGVFVASTNVGVPFSTARCWIVRGIRFLEVRGDAELGSLYREIYGWGGWLYRTQRLNLRREYRIRELQERTLRELEAMTL